MRAPVGGIYIYIHVRAEYGSRESAAVRGEHLMAFIVEVENGGNWAFDGTRMMVEIWWHEDTHKQLSRAHSRSPLSLSLSLAHNRVSVIIRVRMYILAGRIALRARDAAICEELAAAGRVMMFHWVWAFCTHYTQHTLRLFVQILYNHRSK